MNNTKIIKHAQLQPQWRFSTPQPRRPMFCNWQRPSWSKRLTCRLLSCYVFTQEAITPLICFVAISFYDIIAGRINSNWFQNVLALYVRLCQLCYGTCPEMFTYSLTPVILAPAAVNMHWYGYARNNMCCARGQRIHIDQSFQNILSGVCTEAWIYKCFSSPNIETQKESLMI